MLMGYGRQRIIQVEQNDSQGITTGMTGQQQLNGFKINIKLQADMKTTRLFLTTGLTKIDEHMHTKVSVYTT